MLAPPVLVFVFVKSTFIWLMLVTAESEEGFGVGTPGRSARTKLVALLETDPIILLAVTAILNVFP